MPDDIETKIDQVFHSKFPKPAASTDFIVFKETPEHKINRVEKNPTDEDQKHIIVYWIRFPASYFGTDTPLRTHVGFDDREPMSQHLVHVRITDALEGLEEFLNRQELAV